MFESCLKSNPKVGTLTVRLDKKTRHLTPPVKPYPQKSFYFCHKYRQKLCNLVWSSHIAREGSTGKMPANDMRTWYIDEDRTRNYRRITRQRFVKRKESGNNGRTLRLRAKSYLENETLLISRRGETCPRRRVGLAKRVINYEIVPHPAAKCVLQSIIHC